MISLLDLPTELLLYVAQLIGANQPYAGLLRFGASCTTLQHIARDILYENICLKFGQSGRRISHFHRKARSNYELVRSFRMHFSGLGIIAQVNTNEQIARRIRETYDIVGWMRNLRTLSINIQDTDSWYYALPIWYLRNLLARLPAGVRHLEIDADGLDVGEASSGASMSQMCPLPLLLRLHTLRLQTKCMCQSMLGELQKDLAAEADRPQSSLRVLVLRFQSAISWPVQCPWAPSTEAESEPYEWQHHDRNDGDASSISSSPSIGFSAQPVAFWNFADHSVDPGNVEPAFRKLHADGVFPHLRHFLIVSSHMDLTICPDRMLLVSDVLKGTAEKVRQPKQLSPKYMFEFLRPNGTPMWETERETVTGPFKSVKDRMEGEAAWTELPNGCRLPPR